MKTMDFSSHPVVVEYAVRECFKHRTPLTAARTTKKNLAGFTNLLRGVWLGRTPIKTPGGMVLDLAHFEYHPGLALSSYRGSALAMKELAQAEKRAAKYA